MLGCTRPMNLNRKYIEFGMEQASKRCCCNCNSDKALQRKEAAVAQLGDVREGNQEYGSSPVIELLNV